MKLIDKLRSMFSCRVCRQQPPVLFGWYYVHRNTNKHLLEINIEYRCPGCGKIVHEYKSGECARAFAKKYYKYKQKRVKEL